MAVNYNDERFKKVEADKQQALSELEKTYGGMINESDKYYQAQIDASKQWAETQKQNQQAQTDFAIEKINQEKEQAAKDYTREQSGAYVDWQKESNRYGVNAEELAVGGLNNSGYGESSQVRMYNTYQNRVFTAREAYNQAVLNYNNAIKDAQLQNNAVLAEIAYKAQQEQLELSLNGFQYKNQLVLEKANKKTETEQIYHNRYQDVLQQINTENALAEEIRQFNAQLEEEKRQYNQSYALQQAQLAEEKRQFNAQMAAKGGSISSGSSGGSSSRSVSSSKQTNQQRIAADNPQVNSNRSASLSKAGYKDAGVNAGQITMNSASAFGLSNDSRIVTKDGKYYAVEDEGLVDVSFSKPVINMLKNFVPSMK